MKKIKILLIAIIFFSFSSMAQPGSLDATFGDSGKIIGEIQGYINTAILQNNGKIVAGGIGEDFVLIAFLGDGKIDTSFGVQGLVKNIFKEYTSQEVNKIMVLPEGKFITVGKGSKNNPYTEDILIARYNLDGTPDVAFGDSGRIILDFGYDESPTDMEQQPDGKIVIRGTIVTNVSQAIVNVFLTRIFPDGSLDISFGKEGLVTWNGIVSTFSQGLALQQDGKIVVPIKKNSTPQSFALLRFNENGSLDSSFGRNGYLKTDLPNSPTEYLNDVVVRTDGKILATGVADAIASSGQLCVLLFNTDGTLEKTFGIDGITIVKFDDKSYSKGSSICLQNNGKIVVGGSIYQFSPQVSDFALLRLNSNGSIDSSFGNEGRQLSDFGGYDYISEISIQKDGKLVAIGVGGENNYALARYFGDPTKPRPTIAQIKRWIRNHILHFEDANTNAAYYVIEKSTATNTGFVPVTKITANATTTNYSYTLPEAATQSTYRIKAVNKDNSITYSSPISSSDPAKAGVASFKVYPNPAKDRITIETIGTVQLRLQNSNGRVLLTQTVNGKGSIDINKLPNGIYYVVNTVNGESLKVVKE